MAALQDKAIVITGSTRGFGFAIARACADAGAQDLHIATVAVAMPQPAHVKSYSSSDKVSGNG